MDGNKADDRWEDTYQDLVVAAALGCSGDSLTVVGESGGVEDVERFADGLDGDAAVEGVGEEVWVQGGGGGGVGGGEGDGARGERVHEGDDGGEVVLWGADGGGADVLEGEEE